MDDEVTTSAGAGTVAAKRRRRAIYTAALAGGLALGGFGIAAAQTDTTSPPTTAAPNDSTAPAPSQKPPGDGPRAHKRMRGPGGPGGFGMMGAGGAIHGELTVPDGNGGYRTMVIQRGTVTAVSSTSVTVKSDDGYTKTYEVDDNTLVNAGNEGIGDVNKDDKVDVQGFMEGSTAHAARVMDETGIGAIRDHWKPKSA
jgi:hypothetical protein